MQEIKINGSLVRVLPVIKGLVSEGETVHVTIVEQRPVAVAISISKEELEGLRTYEGEEIELSELEEAYKAGLEEFGKVQLPPPCYLETVKACEELGIPLIPIDMEEDLFSERYCELIGGMELFKESFFTHRLAKKRFDLESAGSFVLDYDRKVNGGHGIRALNLEREMHMATTLQQLAQRYNPLIAVVELERVDGVVKKIMEIIPKE